METYLTQADLDDLYKHNPDVHLESKKHYRISVLDIYKATSKRKDIIYKQTPINNETNRTKSKGVV